jgi:beta-glucanase (GH16 family)
MLRPVARLICAVVAMLPLAACAPPAASPHARSLVHSPPSPSCCGESPTVQTLPATPTPLGTVLPSISALPGGYEPSATPTSTPEPTPTPTPYSFDDEFSGTSVDTSNWLVNTNASNGNGELQCFQAANVAESGGLLTETAQVDPGCGADGYSSGAIQSKASYLYGTFTVRAEMPGGTGLWPAIWLLGTDCQPWRMGSNNCNWPNPGSDEVDIAEILNNSHTSVNEQIHSSGGSPQCSPTVSDVSQDYHTYTLIWSPGSDIFQIDGVTTCTLTGAAVSSSPMFLIINNSVGGTGGGAVDNATLPQSLAVDYVRITS